MTTTTLLLGLKESSLPPAQLARLRGLSNGRQLVITDDRPAMETVLGDVEIAVAGVPHELILRAPHLRWYQQWGAGADWLLRHPEVADRDFVLTNTSGVHAIPISEHILAMMLAFARGLPEATRNQDRHAWHQRHRGLRAGRAHGALDRRGRHRAAYRRAVPGVGNVRFGRAPRSLPGGAGHRTYGRHC